MFTFSMEPGHWISCVVDNLQFALLVIIAVSAMENTIGVSLLISKLSVVPHTSVVSKSVAVWSTLTVNLESKSLGLRVRFPAISSCSGIDSSLKIMLFMGHSNGLTDITVNITLSLAEYLDT